MLTGLKWLYKKPITQGLSRSPSILALSWPNRGPGRGGNSCRNHRDASTPAGGKKIKTPSQSVSSVPISLRNLSKLKMFLRIHHQLLTFYPETRGSHSIPHYSAKPHHERAEQSPPASRCQQHPRLLSSIS